MFPPVEPHHDPEAVPEGRVEEPPRRTRVDPDDVEAVRGHLGEVSFHGLCGEALFAVLVDEERAVADSANPELFVSQIEELPTNRGAPHP